METAALSIEDAINDLKDPRSRTSEHDLTEMLVVALCAILCGADSTATVGIRIRRMKACANDNYLVQILGLERLYGRLIVSLHYAIALADGSGRWP